MSDGHADAMNHIAVAIEDYLESLVRYHEHFAIPEFTGIVTNTPKDRLAILGDCVIQSAAIKEEIRRCTDELLKIDPYFLIQVMKIRNHDAFVAYTELPFPGLEDLFLLLQANGKLSKIIRLQQATEFRNMLLVFTDENWRILPNGVHYQSPLKFVDGEQDVLLGFWKQRCSGRRSAPVDRRLPLMIVGSKSYACIHWKLVTAFQPSF
ncbi:MAG: hypothetical protein WCT26_04840 [Candidatus Buchananbacteria bacterium]|jgi:hypothetical protein